MNTSFVPGPGDIGWGSYFPQFDPEAPNLAHEIEDLMASGARFDPRDGDVIAEAIGTMTEGQLIDAGRALNAGDDAAFCRHVRRLVDAWCLEQATVAAGNFHAVGVGQ